MLKLKFSFLLLLLPISLIAQDFEVSPVLMSFTADPGEAQTRQIMLINHSPKPQKYTLKLADYTTDNDGNKKPAPAGSTKRSCADWLTLNPSFVELNPNQSITIDAMMSVPRDGFTARWCMVYIEAAHEQSPFEADKSLATGVTLVPRIVILVKQSPKSNQNYQATISNLREITKPGDSFRTFKATITNTGENIIDANVNLDIANMQTAAEQKFPPVKVTVYPDASRDIELQLPTKNLNKGKYALAAILDYGHRQPLGGTQLLLEVK